MSNVDLLKYSVDEWNQWRENHSVFRPDFRKEFLREANLQGANLRGADLGEANLEGANLENANLQQANLDGAILIEANLKRVDLRGAYLFEFDLEKTNLQEANLARVVLQAANLRDANLKGANLQGTNLRGADLQRANLEEAYLEKAALNWSQLQGANLFGADLQRADLVGAHLEETNLQKAIFQKADLQGANLYSANCREVNFMGSNLYSANCREANLMGSNFQQANLIDAEFTGANFTGTILWETQRAGWKIEGVICEYMFWDIKGENKEIFEEGQFEKLYSGKNNIELVYEKGISPIEIATLPMLLRHLETINPGTSLRLSSINEFGGGGKVTIAINDVAKENPEVLSQKIKGQAEELKQAQQNLLNEIKGRETAENLLNAYTKDIIPMLLDRMGSKTEIYHMNVDKSTNKTVIGNVSGTGIAIGKGASAKVTQGIASSDFAKIISYVETKEGLSAEEKGDINELVSKIQKETDKGTEAEPSRLEKLFSMLQTSGPEILNVAVESLENPLKGVGLALKIIQGKIKVERNHARETRRA